MRSLLVLTMLLVASQALAQSRVFYDATAVHKSGAQSLAGPMTLTCSACTALTINAASGQDALKTLDGAKLNLSTADTNARIYRSANNIIAIEGGLVVGAVTGGSLNIFGPLKNSSAGHGGKVPFDDDLTGVYGANGSGGTPGAAGTAITVQGGNGGAGTATAAAGAGATLTLKGGDAGTAAAGGGANGGGLTLTAGAATGAGTPGVLSIGETNTSFVRMGAAAIAVVVTGDLKLGGSSTTCDVNMRNRFRITQGGAGVADKIECCMKAAADTYAWRTVYTAP